MDLKRIDQDGLKVFPVKLAFDAEKSKWRKTPAVPKGVHWGEYKASEGELKKARHFGVVIPKGVLLVDIDTHKGATREKIEEVLGCKLPWDEAAVQKTVSGGEHYAFSVDEGLSIKQGSDLLGVQGFDTRCEGRGWIAFGEGYEDLNLLGMPNALSLEDWPRLPEKALQMLKGGVSQTMGIVGLEDLQIEIAASTIIEDLLLDEARSYLKRLPLEDVDQYDSWLRVGMALWHQYKGSKKGFELWREWSETSKHYDLEELKAKWLSFRKHPNPTTFASVIKRAGGRAAATDGLFASILEKSKVVETLDQYNALKKELRGIGYDKIQDDLRSIIATELVRTFGKVNGISKADIKKAISPKRQRAVSEIENGPAHWCGGWVYIEKSCEFSLVGSDHSIKREAFNAKFDREPDCQMAEKSAAQMALVNYRIPTVADKMYWPGAGEIFEYEGKAMLNVFRASGVRPSKEFSPEGLKAIERFMDHVKFTLPDEREQGILLDWLSYVIQNPGKRINWALLLQGAQGTGKSYFVHLLQMILGENVRNLDPMAIAGRFTGWAHGALVVAVEEIRISGTNRYEVLDRLKPFITNPTIQIEEKGRDHRTVPNFSSYIMLTNHKDAIPITYGDRRYCVLFSRVQSEDQLYSELGGEEGSTRYFDRLFEDSRVYAGELSKWFRERVVSDQFEPQGRAPKTEAREKMMASAVSPERMMVEDAIAKHECTVIGQEVLDVTHLKNLCEMEGDELPNNRALASILLEMGYEQIKGRKITISNTRRGHYIWTRALEEEKAKILVQRYHKDPEDTPPF
jgi:hypothetical protein